MEELATCVSVRARMVRESPSGGLRFRLGSAQCGESRWQCRGTELLAGGCRVGVQ